jgi:hypothetical protein
MVFIEAIRRAGSEAGRSWTNPQLKNQERSAALSKRFDSYSTALGWKESE